MRSFVFQTLSVFGRYTVVFLIPVGLLLAWLWSGLLSNHVTLAIILAVPLLILAMALLVIVLGVLLAGAKRPLGNNVDRSDAPEIWSHWDRASPRSKFTRRQILIDDEINASMAESSLVAGLIGRDQTLTLGLGLMVILDQPMFEAVLEHEFAHADFKHSNGLTRVYEFFGTFEAFGEALEGDLELVARVLSFAFVRLENWLYPEMMRRSRQSEFEADRQAAERVGRDIEAQGQLILEGATRIAKTLIFQPIERELVQAVSPPRSPLERIQAMRDELTDPIRLKEALTDVLAEPIDPQATHPSLAERLESIGRKPDMPIGSIGPPAFTTMLPPDTQRRLEDESKKEWDRIARSWVEIE